MASAAIVGLPVMLIMVVERAVTRWHGAATLSSPPPGHSLGGPRRHAHSRRAPSRSHGQLALLLLAVLAMAMLPVATAAHAAPIHAATGMPPVPRAATSSAAATATPCPQQLPLTSTLTYLGAAQGIYDTTVTLAALLTDPSGNPAAGRSLAFSYNGQSLNAATNANGLAGVSVPAGAPGANTASVSFAGDGAYSAGQATAIVTVAKAATTLTYSGALPGSSAPQQTVGAVLRDAADGAPVANAVIQFSLGAAMATASTDASGVATATLTLGAGDATSGAPLQVVYAGDTNHLSSQTTVPASVYLPTAFGSVVVRHAIAFNGNGTVQGSVRQLNAENVTLNGNGAITGNLFVPGSPTVQLQGHPNFGGVVPGTGSAQPTTYTITLNGNAQLGHLLTRTDPVSMPALSPPPPPAGTRDVTINGPGQSIGDPTTLHNLTLNGNAGAVAVPPGTYGQFSVNGGGNSLVLGMGGATRPAVYNLQGMSFNGTNNLQVAGPVILNLAGAVTLNGQAGVVTNPLWLILNIANGGVTLNGGSTLYGIVYAPGGAVSLAGHTLLSGAVFADSLTVSGGSLVQGAQAPAGYGTAPALLAGQAEPSLVLPGQTFGVTLSATNTTSVAAANVVAQESFGGATPLSGTASLGTIASGSGVTASFTQTAPTVAPLHSAESSTAYETRLAAQDGQRLTALGTLTFGDAGGQAYSPVNVSSATSLGLPRLALALSAPVCAGPGASVPYTLRIANLGSAPAVSGTVTLTFPDGTTGTLPIGAIAPGASATGTLTWTVPAAPAKGRTQSDTSYLAGLGSLDGSPLAATATLSWQDAQGNAYGAVTQNVTTTEALPIVQITMSGPATAKAGDPIAYTVALTNTGHAPATHLGVTVTLPDGSTTTPSAGDLAPGASAQLTVPFTIPAAQPSGPVTASAGLTWQDSAGNGYGPVSAQASTAVSAAPPSSKLSGATLTLVPNTAGPDVTGTTQALTATLTGHNGAPLANVTITFTVSGPNATSATATTDATGAASFSYQGNSNGTDTVQATASDGVVQVQSNQATVGWVTPAQQVSTVTVFARFFNSDGSGDFNTLPSQAPAFTEIVPTINFNPPGGTVPGAPGGFNEWTRPMVDVTTDPNGNYTGSITAQGNGYAAGTGALFSFNAVFTSEFVVAAAGDITFNFYSDDGFLIGVGGGATRVGGVYEGYIPPSGLTAFANLPIMGAFNHPSAPAGNTVTVHFPAAGSYPYEVDYSECCGGQLALTMAASSAGGHGVPPTGSLALSPNSGVSQPIGQPQSFAVTARDASGAALTNLPVVLAITGANTQRLNATTNASGVATFAYTGTISGSDTVQAIATVSGLPSYSGVTQVQWTPAPLPPPVSQPPLAEPGWIGGPADHSTVSGMVPIVLAAGETLQSGTIDYWPVDSPSSVTTLAKNVHGGSGATLATLDTTLLENGSYIIQLQGTDNTGNQVDSEILVTVAGDNKPGRVTFTVNDFTLPVAGLPIQIGRTYDSLNRGQSGDFGNGWSLSLASPRLEVSPAHDVTLTLPNGKRATFLFTPRPQNFIFGFLLTPQYTPAPGVYGSLTANGCGLVVAASSGYICFLDSSPDYQPTQYTYTDPYGRVYTMGADGSLQGVQDLNGNTLTVSPNGITSSDGNLSVPFVRDGQGRITRITDPNGHAYTYGYDAAGNLATVTWPGATTPISYTYDASHLLLSAVNPRGNAEAQTSYYPDGRLQSVTDAVGDTTTYTYSLSGATSTTAVTYPNGGVTTLTYDAAGNLLSQTDPLGRTTTSTYDGNNNMLSQADALGQTTTYGYDSNGNQTAVTDPLGYTSSTTYNQFGGPTSKTDALDNVQTITYDNHFNIAAISDALGTLHQYAWDNNGNLLSHTDANGQTTTYSYDAFGNKISQTDALSGTTTYTYDQMGHVLTSTDPLGRATRYTYDPLGHLLTVTDPAGDVTSYEYDADGNKTAQVDPNGHRTTYTYDAANRLIKTTYPDGTTQSDTYDFRGKLLTETDQSGHVTRYTYDLAGQLISISYADGTPDAGSVKYSYDAAGRKISQTDEDGHTTTYAYDADGHLTRATDALGHVTTYGYDAAGNRVSFTDARSNKTSYTYDIRGHQTQTTYADGSTSQQSYDGVGNVVSTTDQAGKTTHNAYDADGRLISVTDALGHIARYTYDADGRRTTQTDANGQTTTFGYDAAGRLVSRTLPLGMIETYGYDPADNRISTIDFNGNTTTYTYDGLNRLLSKTPDPRLKQPSVGYTYTPTGQRATMTDASGTTTYSYDNRDRLIRKNTPEGTLSYSYDAAGNVLAMRSSHSNGVAVSYGYDALNRLSTVTDNTGTTAYGYDANGNMTGYTYPNGVAAAYTYDALNRLTNLALGTTSTLTSYAYTLGPAGNRLSVTEGNGRQVAYDYDALYRLTGETVSGDPSTAANGAISYAYDAVGNRLSRTSTLAALPSTSDTYDANDRLTRDSFDANGNTTTAGSASYGYDFENHLTSVNGGSTTVVYDGDGNRVAETVGGVTTYYLVDDLNPTQYPQVVEEIANGQVRRTYTYGTALISETQLRGGAWTPSFYSADGLGNVRLLTDSTGTVTDQYTYDAFGDVVASTGSTPNSYLFAGEQFDANLGSYYLRARYYTPDQGRFITADTFSGDAFDPVTLHKYLYANADPINNADPTGQEAIALEYGVTLDFVAIRSAVAVAAVGAATACLLSLSASAIGAPLPPSDPCQIHRGRIQVQGSDLIPNLGTDTISEAWNRNTPPTVAEGLAWLAGLQGQLNKKQLKRRDQAFTKAQRFITNAGAAGGVGPTSQTFQNYPVPTDYPDARVDIEVKVGRAFVP